MLIDQITQKFISNPVYLTNGAGFLSKQWDCSKADVYKAKDKAREMIYEAQTAQLQNIIAEQEDVIAKYIGSETTEEGTVKKFESANPLSPQEIEKLAGVDGINTYVARVWDKLQNNGIWTYSIDIRYRVKDFYSADDLKAKLKELMPEINPIDIPKISFSEKLALVIAIADDHCGSVNDANLFDKEKLTYKDKLLGLLSEIDTQFEEVHVISLGDQLNGWNSQTTRGGHEVKSLSNEEQFDEYVKARVAFYDGLFLSGISENYYLHDVENSNHSGLGMSYMANRALEMYVSAKYPSVVRESTHDMLGGFQYGQHVILFGHGKDEKLQKRPMPYNLDAKTDLYLYDYLQNKGYSPYSINATFYKGDLHQHGMQRGKFGRYINVPAISGATEYSEVNFGSGKAGALLEYYDKASYRVISQAVWF